MQTSITPEELADMDDVTILDVRKKPAYDEDTVVIAGRHGETRRRSTTGSPDWPAT